jgi:hypothetical protein
VTLHHVKPLNNNQYDSCRTEAVQRVQAKVGERPERKHFERELEPLWQPLDVIALIVGLSAWLVSSIHILTHAGRMAAQSFAETVAAVNLAGFHVSEATYGHVHQLGLITLAESAMILFMVMHSSRLKPPQRRAESNITYAMRTGPSIPLLLALMAAGFTLYANMQSGVGILESLLPPAVTIGLGIYFERIIAEMIKRRKDVTARYLEAMRIWEAAQRDIESHPDFLPFFRQALAQKIMSLKPQKDYPQVPIAVVKQAVAREMYRDQWAFEDDSRIIEQVRGIMSASVPVVPASPPSSAVPPGGGDVNPTPGSSPAAAAQEPQLEPVLRTSNGHSQANGSRNGNQ